MDHCMDLFEPMDTCGSDTVSDFSFLHNRIPSVDPSLHHFKQRKKKASALNDSDWEPYRERIFALHASGTSHKDIREIIREEEGFYPESRQYKSRFKKWGLNKNIKEAEKRAIVRKMQEMNLTEVDKRELVFWVGCQRVDSAKIQSWKQNRNSSGTSPYAPAPGASTPPTIRSRTVSEPDTPRQRHQTPPSASIALHGPQMLAACAQEEYLHGDHMQYVPLEGLDAPYGSMQYIPVGDTPAQQGAMQYYNPFDMFAQDSSTEAETFRDNQLFSRRRAILDLWSSFFNVEISRLEPSSERFNDYRKISDICLAPFTETIWHTSSDSLLFLPNSTIQDLHTLRKVLEYWLSIGCHIDHRNLDGQTPLLYFCTKSGMGLQYLSLLLAKRANVDAVDFGGRGALHLLMQSFVGGRHARHSSKRKQDRSKEEKAEAFRWFTKVEAKLSILLQAGCKPALRDNAGKTPDDYVEKGSDCWDVWKSALSKRKQLKDLLTLCAEAIRAP